MEQLSPHPGLLSPGGRGVAVGPILSDSASDIFCGNENSPNFLFHNRGDGTFRDVAAAVGEWGTLGGTHRRWGPQGRGGPACPCLRWMSAGRRDGPGDAEPP